MSRKSNHSDQQSRLRHSKYSARLAGSSRLLYQTTRGNESFCVSDIPVVALNCWISLRYINISTCMTLTLSTPTPCTNVKCRFQIVLNGLAVSTRNELEFTTLNSSNMTEAFRPFFYWAAMVAMKDAVFSIHRNSFYWDGLTNERKL